MSTKKYNNAATEYDNTVEPSKKKGGLLSKMKSALSDGLNTISGGTFSKLNALVSGLKNFDLSAFANKLGSKLSGMLKSYLNNAISMLKDMASDTLKSLKNAGKNFILNMAEQFYNDIKATLYIEDIIFAQTIKALYYSGADLAYNDHYIRNQALTRDWNYTLEFIDGEYKIDYSLEYDKLETDLKKAARSGSYKNIEYIFGKMIDNRNKVVSEIASIDNSLENTTYDQTHQKALNTSRETLVKNRNKYDSLIVYYTKVLITYGYSSLSASKVKRLITNTNGIVLPKYFGTTDDKYSKKYNFNTSDILKMMPTFTQHQLTNSDKQTLQDIEEDLSEIEKETDDLRDDAETDEIMSDLAEEWGDGLVSWGVKNNTDTTALSKYAYKTASYYKTKSKLETWRANYRSKQASNTKAMSVSALKKGVNKTIKDNRSRYHKNYDGSSVKYQGSMTTDFLDKAGSNDEYITLRNNNIKSIYILLSSKEIYGNNCMVNDIFYNRCKMKTMTTLMSSWDKAKGLLGASSLVQSIYDIQDVIDSSAYNYTKKVENYLFDPAKNTELGDVFTGNFSGFNSLQYDTDIDSVTLPVIDETSGTIVNTSNVADAIKNYNNIQPPASSSTTSNETTTDEIDKKINSTDVSTKKKLLNTTRYLNKLPMVSKRDIIVKYMTWFYNTLIDTKLSETIAKYCLSTLVYKIIGRNNINNTNQLQDLFADTTNTNLTNNLTNMISIGNLGLLDEYLGLSSKYDNETVKTIVDTYNTMNYIMSIEVKSISFAKSVFTYDNDYTKTLAKQKFLAQMDQLDKLVKDGKTSRSEIWEQKDKFTKQYDGFDRFGIFGVDERSGFQVKYTNIETGDWNSILVSNKGTFFGGSDNTKNNGIRYLDEGADEIVATNITNGTWTIFEKLGEVFFLNTDGDLYIWNESSSTPKLLLSKVAKNYDFIEFKDLNFLFMVGKTNNAGLLFFRNGNFDTLVNTGVDFRYFIDKNLLFFYSEKSSVPIISIDKSTGSYNRVTNDSVIVTTPIPFTIVYTITSISFVTNPTTGAVITQTNRQITYRHHLLFGRQDGKGVYDLVNTSTIENEYDTSWEISSDLVFSNENIHLIQINKKIYAFKDNSPNTEIGHGYIISPIYTRNITTYDIITDLSSNQIEDEYESVDLIEDYANAHNFTLTDNNILFFTMEEKEIDSSTNRTVWVQKFFSHRDTNNISRMSSVNDDRMNNISFYNPRKNDDELIFAIDSSSILYYYNKSSNSIIKLFNDTKFYKSGWEFIDINNRYASLYNPLVSSGLILYDKYSNTIVKTNIISGYWKMIEGYKYYYAISQNGTNKGFKYSSKGKFIFSDVSEADVGRYDIPGYAYDSDKKRIYFGVNRSKNDFSTDYINYDIDEYVYLQNTYTLYKDIEKSDNNVADTMLNEVTNTLIGNTSDNYTIVSDTSGTPDSNTEYFIKDSNDNYISVGYITEFDPNETYYTKKETGNTSDNYTSIGEIKENLASKWDTYKDSIEEMEKSSPIYVDMVTTAMANTEFDVDDENMLQDIKLDLILGDEGKNSTAFLLLEDNNKKYYIKNEEDKYKNLSPTSNEWNMIYDNATSAFLNADEDDIDNIPHS